MRTTQAKYGVIAGSAVMEEQHHREQMTRLTSQILLVYIGVYMVVAFTKVYIGVYKVVMFTKEQ